MFILLADETNTEPTNAKFFIYGGLIVPWINVRNIHEEIIEVRTKAGYKPGDKFKFNTRERPNHVSEENAREAKNAVIDLCISNNCKFITHIIHHKIIKNQDKATQVTRAADYVIGRFNSFLEQANDDGICIVDHLPEKSEWKYLSDKFSKGLTINQSNLALDRILSFSATCINASHLNSAMDIVLGCFRYCVNDPSNREIAHTMLTKILKMMWHKEISGKKYFRDYGLIMRPKLENISGPLKTEYDQLILNLHSLRNKETP